MNMPVSVQKGEVDMFCSENRNGIATAKLVLGSTAICLALLRLNRGFPLAIGLHYWRAFAYADVVYRYRY